MGQASRTKWVRWALDKGNLPAGVVKTADGYFMLRGVVWGGGKKAGQPRSFSARKAAQRIVRGWRAPAQEAR